MSDKYMPCGHPVDPNNTCPRCYAAKLLAALQGILARGLQQQEAAQAREAIKEPKEGA